jgi:hypothetical protein
MMGYVGPNGSVASMKGSITSRLGTVLCHFYWQHCLNLMETGVRYGEEVCIMLQKDVVCRALKQLANHLPRQPTDHQKAYIFSMKVTH